MNSFVERWVAMRQGFKPRDVEEPIDYYWHRPLAGLLVQLIEHTKITANQVTFASGFVSLLSGGAMALGGFYGKWWVSIGGLLLLLSIVLDCADGQLARIRGTSSIKKYLFQRMRFASSCSYSKPLPPPTFTTVRSSRCARRSSLIINRY